MVNADLAVFKPKEILDFVYVAEKDREWPADKLAQFQQLNIFEKTI